MCAVDTTGTMVRKTEDRWSTFDHRVRNDKEFILKVDELDRLWGNLPSN